MTIGERWQQELDKKTDKELRKAHNLQKMYKAGSFNG